MGMLVKDPNRRMTLEQVRSLLVREAEVPAAREPDNNPDVDADTDAQRTTPLVVPPLGLVAPRDEDAYAHPEVHPESEPVPERADVEPEPEPVAGMKPLFREVTPVEPDPEPLTPLVTPPPTASADAGAPPRRRRVPATLAVLAIILSAGLGAAAFMMLDDDPATSAGKAGATPSQGPSAPSREGEPDTGGGSSGAQRPEQESPAPQPDVPVRAAPEGFHMHQDPLGFQVAIPDGWQRRLDGPTRVDFVSADGARFLRVDQRANALPDAVRAWEQAEPGVAESLSGYQRIRIEPVPHPTWDVADWEFTWESDSGTIHVLNRGIATDTRGFALYVSAPDATWTTRGRPVFDVASATFRPTA